MLNGRRTGRGAPGEYLAQQGLRIRELQDDRKGDGFHRRFFRSAIPPDRVFGGQAAGTVMKFLKSLADKYWWAAIPLSALSVLSLCLELLETFGLDTRQWLDIVHSIVIRWNYWLDQAFQFIEWIVPFDISVTPVEQNFLVILFLLFVPVLVSTLVKFFRMARFDSPKHYLFIVPVSLLTLFCAVILYSTVFAMLGEDSDGTYTSEVAIGTIIFFLSGLIATYIFRRRFFYGLVFAAALLLCVESLRLVPKIQPQVDALQAWLESVPMAPEADNGAPTP